MDVDRYLLAHQHAWDRLTVLSRRGRSRRARALSPDELDELVRLYQRVSGHLSHVRTTYGDPLLVASLTRIVADANAVIYGSRGAPGAAMRQAVFVTFPAALWRMRWFVVVSFLVTMVPAVAVGTWIALSDAALDATAPEAVRDAYVASDFESYYSSGPAGVFAAEVTFNNIRVAITAFALGVLGCVVTAGILGFNGANVGLAAGLFHAAGEPGRFWGLILPHGLLELTAVIVAGAAGLRLGWTLIDPGDRPRATALAEEGRRAVVVVLGLVVAFVVAGLIEGFVTGSALPTVVRVGTGVVVEVAFIAYVVRFGREAVVAEEASGAGAIAART